MLVSQPPRNGSVLPFHGTHSPPSCHCQLFSTAATLENSRKDSAEARGCALCHSPGATWTGMQSSTESCKLFTLVPGNTRPIPGRGQQDPHSKYYHETLTKAIRKNSKGRACGCYLPSPCRAEGHHLPWRNPWMLQRFPAHPHRWWHSGSSPDDSPSDPWPELPNLGEKGSFLEHKHENSFSNPTGLTLDPGDPEAALLFSQEGCMQCCHLKFRLEFQGFGKALQFSCTRFRSVTCQKQRAGPSMASEPTWGATNTAEMELQRTSSATIAQPRGESFPNRDPTSILYSSIHWKRAQTGFWITSCQHRGTSTALVLYWPHCS